MLGADGSVTCSGAMIAQNIVLTSVRCVLGTHAVVGDETFQVRETHHPTNHQDRTKSMNGKFPLQPSEVNRTFHFNVQAFSK